MDSHSNWSSNECAKQTVQDEANHAEVLTAEESQDRQLADVVSDIIELEHRRFSFRKTETRSHYALWS